MAVCNKAMAVESADRYPTPLDLATDLERWLADEPVSVYTDPWPVRASRWGRRHRTAVAAGMVFLVSSVAALSIGAGLLWHEERKTAEQKREAEENYQLARDLSGSGIELIAANEAQFAADPAKHAARKELLVAAAKAYRKHLQHQPGNPEVRRQAAHVFRYTANVHRLGREHTAAEPLYLDGVELLEELIKQFPDERGYKFDLSQTLRDHSKVQATVGRLAEAAETLTRAVDIAEALHASDPSRPDYSRALAAGLVARSNLEQIRGQFPAAVESASKAADLFRALIAGSAGNHPYDPLLLAGALSAIAEAEREAGHPEKARPFHIEAVKLLTDIWNQLPSGVNKADALYFLASCRFEQCRTWALNPANRAKAETSLDGTISFWTELDRVYPWIPIYRQAAGAAYRLRGQIRLAGQRPDEAKSDLEKSRSLLEAEVARTRDVPTLHGELGRTHAAVGRLARAAGDETAAAESFRKAVEALRTARALAPEGARESRDLAQVETERNAVAQPQ